MKATIVGGGPVGCLLAGKLRARAVEVTVYEQGPDPRQRPVTRGRSFNVTLTRRGIDAVDAELRGQLYRYGVPLWRRIIHRADGSVSHQPYGTSPEHHLLSLPRAVLHRLLLDAAERAGVTIRFDHDCVRVDPRTGRTVFSAGDGLQADAADLVIGADGANSVVRQEMSRRGARLGLHQEPIEHGYVELTMPAGPDGRHAQLDAGDDGSTRHGLHIWPRGDFMLIAQPNHDASHTATLFLPLESTADRPGFDALTTPSAVAAFFEEHFPDAVAHVPRLREDFVAATASSLRTVRCDPFHHGVTALVGDAAHTMPPFLGQGINCSFEDVDVFVELFDEAIRADGYLDVARMLEAFTARRKAPGDAVTDLSIANLRELSWGTAQSALDARRRLEHELHARYPQLFTPPLLPPGLYTHAV